VQISFWLSCVAGYLLGAIPFGMLITHLVARRDVRAVGSGNIGATNVARAAGRTAGIATLILDAAKGALAAGLGLRFFGIVGGAMIGGAAFLGHVFPIYLAFRGGKGVATGLGIFAVLAPAAALAGLCTYGLVFALARISGLGSLVALLAVGTGVAIGGQPPLIALFVVCGSVVIWRHRKNLQQLLKGRATPEGSSAQVTRDIVPSRSREGAGGGVTEPLREKELGDPPP
jgi:acyl phosphate:glycerol-3-phosphate acyltransferase